LNGTPPQSMANFMSIEMSEHRYPLRFRHYAIREDSGGAGRYRGGCGTSYSFEADSNLSVSVLGDRVDYRPFGTAGGKAAAANEVKFRVGNQEIVPPMRSKYEKQLLSAGDALIACSPGGGGFGNPLERETEAVERDLNLGYVSRESAERDYGVVIAEARQVGERTRYRLDVAATERRRQQLRASGKA
ncbi:MAG: hydantoinase B/oxoprolinase family protein, partial [Dongiaceae bacterium]